MQQTLCDKYGFDKPGREWRVALLGFRVAELELAQQLQTSVLAKNGEAIIEMFHEFILSKLEMQVSERIRQHVGNIPIHLPDHSIPITISIGLTHFKGDDNLESLLQRADRAMYTAKQAGRNCVAIG